MGTVIPLPRSTPDNVVSLDSRRPPIEADPEVERLVRLARRAQWVQRLGLACLVGSIVVGWGR